MKELKLLVNTNENNDQANSTPLNNRKNSIPLLSNFTYYIELITQQNYSYDFEEIKNTKRNPSIITKCKKLINPLAIDQSNTVNDAKYRDI